MTNDHQITYLTMNQVIAINTMQIHTFSPEEHIGVREPGLLESALYSPQQTVFEKVTFPTFYEKAAVLTDSLAKNHAFHNANKRTALASLIIFLKLNGYKWTMDVESEQNFIVDIVNHNHVHNVQETASLIEEPTIKE